MDVFICYIFLDFSSVTVYTPSNTINYFSINTDINEYE